MTEVQNFCVAHQIILNFSNICNLPHLLIHNREPVEDEVRSCSAQIFYKRVDSSHRFLCNVRIWCTVAYSHVVKPRWQLLYNLSSFQAEVWMLLICTKNMGGNYMNFGSDDVNCLYVRYGWAVFILEPVLDASAQKAARPSLSFQFDVEVFTLTSDFRTLQVSAFY